MAATPRKRGRAGQVDRIRRLKRTNGLCERCRDRGLIVLATRVDHIVPLTHGGPDVDTNTRNLCEPCHLEVTAEQFGHVRKAGMGACDVHGHPTHPDHAWARLAQQGR
jgi:5-methylcytosine-specific restriction enzyme A